MLSSDASEHEIITQ